jgi:Tfp pilus assembly protein PilO
MTKSKVCKPKPKRRAAKPAVSLWWSQFGSPVAVALVVSLIMSVFGWVAFRATVIEKLDTLTTTVNEIKKDQMPRTEIDSDLHGVTDRLGADEHRIDQMARQLHDDELLLATHSK